MQGWQRLPDHKINAQKIYYGTASNQIQTPLTHSEQSYNENSPKSREEGEKKKRHSAHIKKPTDQIRSDQVARFPKNHGRHHELTN